MTARDAAVAMPAVDPLHFRQTVSHFATGIAVVSSFDDDDQPQGMTVNSFTSVSLDPPTVPVSLRPGRTHRTVRRRGAAHVFREPLPQPAAPLSVGAIATTMLRPCRPAYPTATGGPQWATIDW